MAVQIPAKTMSHQRETEKGRISVHSLIIFIRLIAGTLPKIKCQIPQKIATVAMEMIEQRHILFKTILFITPPFFLRIL